MTRPQLLLWKKELRQNSLFYLFPLPFIIALAFLKLTGAATGLSWLVPVFSVAIPFTLAVAYGLQAFDIEEDKQTRDFLLAKPLSIWRIVLEKYLIGIMVLFFWNSLFWWLTPSDLFQFPQTESVGSWSGWLIIAGVLLTYSCSFLTGLGVHGPKKLLAVLLTAPLTLAWAFLSWSSWTTILLHNFTLRQTPGLTPALVLIFALAVCSSLVFVMISAAAWLLQQRPSFREHRGLTAAIFPPIILLLTGLLLNITVATPLRTSSLIGLELFGLEKSAFWALEGDWNPKNNLLAVSGPNYRIGLADPGQKPEVLYQSNSKNQGIIHAPTWSPNGNYLAFEEEGKIYVLNAHEKSAPIWIGDGTNPCWDHLGNALLFLSAESHAKQIQTEYGPLLIFHQLYYRADLKTSMVRPHLEFDAEGNHWTWDDTKDTIWYVSPAGKLISANLNGVSSHPILNTPSDQRLIYAKFYRINHASPKFIVTLYYINQNKQHIDVYFHLLDPDKPVITPLHKELGLDLTTLIFHPQTGSYLIGKNGAFTKRQIPKYGEVIP